MHKIKVKCKKNKYYIYIISELNKHLNLFTNIKKNKQIMLVTNEKLFSIYSELINKVFINKKIQFNYIVLPEGENFKNLSTANLIFTELIKKKYGRDTILISFGGGVINDLTGFVAATYQRGVNLVHIPTTLLSQVDAAIGGKTAVNHELGKNMIGSFYQPNMVIIDINFLKTLQKREIISGIAEIVKYGIVFDKKFFIWIEKNIEKLIKLDSDIITECIKRCCMIKTKIITMDEYDNNIRMILNLGHTYGHAIETFTNYNGTWSHGESVSAGIVMASRASYLMKKISKNDFERIYLLLKKIGLPTQGPKEMKKKDYISNMIYDKKVINNKIRIILPVKIGKAEIFENLKEEIIYKSIK